MSEKKRILFIGEASFLNTGFSTYYRELLPRLAETGKYEIAEMGSYAYQNDPRVKEFIAGRWKFYGVMPENQEEAKAFNQPCPHPRGNGQNTNQFGEYKFNPVLADFKPDIVIDIRDWWMLEFQERSVFRPWYKWVIMPTVDAEPQLEQWIDTYENANMVLSYSDYGVHVLKRQSQKLPDGRRKMKIFPKAMRPGVDLKTFTPMNKDEVRGWWNLNKTMPIIGTVMRNQSRKLYPDLIDGFARMKQKYQGNSSVDKAVLLIHSSWPDNAHSYDYPRHIMRLESYDWMPYHSKGIRGSILQSMFCHACNEPSVTSAMNLWAKPVQDGRIKLPCPHCGKVEASPPNTSVGFDRPTLAKLYNLMNLYIQCSICEGDGMPIQEAKACGLPTLVMDYTAMREKGRYPNYDHFEEIGINESNYSCQDGGEIINVRRYYYEPETSCKRALPDIEDMADKMFQIISDEEKNKQMSVDARKCTEDNYDWNVLFKQWEFVLDNIKPLDRSKTWDSPIIEAKDPTPPSLPSKDMTDDEFIEWLYTQVLGYPSIDPDGAKTWIANLKSGVTRQQLLQHFYTISNQENQSQKVRDSIRKHFMNNQLVKNNPDNRSQEFI